MISFLLVCVDVRKDGLAGPFSMAIRCRDIEIKI